MRRITTLLVATLLLSPHLWAQQKIISGKVTNREGNPIASATVLVKGTTTGTSTQADGKFEYMEKVEKLRLVDFDILFKRNGLKLKKVFGDYSLNEYDPEYSPRLIMVVEKD
jgi:hypothetical protein